MNKIKLIKVTGFVILSGSLSFFIYFFCKEMTLSSKIGKNSLIIEGKNNKTIEVKIEERQSQVLTDLIESVLVIQSGEEKVYLDALGYGDKSHYGIVEASLSDKNQLFIYTFRGWYEHSYSHIEFNYILNDNLEVVKELDEKYIQFNHDHIKGMVVLFPFIVLGLGLLLLNYNKRMESDLKTPASFSNPSS